MKRKILTFVAALAVSGGAAAARQAAAPPALLIDHFVGHWVLRGTLDGKQTTHDVDSGIIGHGKPTATTIPFLLKFPNGGVFHTSFIYTPGTDSWQWTMDDESGGKLTPFGRVTLTRKK